MQVPHPGDDRHRRSGHGVRRSTVHRIVGPFRAGPGPGRAHRARSLQARARADDDHPLAQVPDLRGATHPRHALAHRRSRRVAEGPEVQQIRPAAVCAQPAALAQRRGSGAGRHLHAPGMPAEAALRRGRAVCGLAGRLLLPLPRVAVRSRRPGVRRLPGLDQPAGPAVLLSERAHPGDRCGRERSHLMTVKTATGAPARLPGGAGPKHGLLAWLNKRLPVDEFIHEQLTGYYAPKNFNIWYFFGSLALLVLVMQLVTGIFLTMFYKPGELTAFDSVEYIMREVDFGWLIRYLHSTGASAFFIVVYLHMFRAFLYGSYRAPRELLWLIGMLVYLALMAEAFMGYVLPWGNMSFWGAQVIVNLFGTIPAIGTPLVDWIRGDYAIADATLK